MIDTQTQCYTSEWQALQLIQTGAAAPVNGNYTDEGRPSFAEMLTRYTDAPEPTDGDGYHLTEEQDTHPIEDAGTSVQAPDEEDFFTDTMNADFAELIAALQITGNTAADTTAPAEDAQEETAAFFVPDIPETADMAQHDVAAPPVANETAAVLDTGIETISHETAAADDRGLKVLDNEVQARLYEADSRNVTEDAAVFVSETGAEEDSSAPPQNEKSKITAHSPAESLAAAEKPREKQMETGGRGGENAGERGQQERAPARARSVKIEVSNLRTDTGMSKQIEEVTRHDGGTVVQEVEIVDGLKDTGTIRRDMSFASFRAEKSLENFLARELHQNLNGDIVRQAQVMLRNNNEGTIRLALHPQSLGRVAIRLELAGNQIKGAIVVETPEALRAFEQERASLEESFRNAGFDGASLNTTLADGNADGEAGRQQDFGPRTRTADIAAVRYENTIGQSNTIMFYESGSGASIDVLA